MRNRHLLTIYTMTFFSGAAALLYEICWFRSLSLVVGGTQLAVTTTVSVFMMGLALGNWLVARHMHRFKNLLFLYGFLEFGIALSAIVFLVLMKAYPSIYIPLAHIAPSSLVYLTIVRIVLSAAAMILPAAFMGATLPVLIGWTTGGLKSLPGNLSLLYGCNTLGAVAGAVGTGFFLLKQFPVSEVILLTAASNGVIGLVSFNIRTTSGLPCAAAARESDVRSSAMITPLPFASKLILWGIGISGFCALGYEVLWTKVLILFLGASVYSFTLILVVFLLGISLGSAAYGACDKIIASGWNTDGSSSTVVFGVTQLLIGLCTVLIMPFVLDIPAYSVFIQHHLFRITGRNFLSHQVGNFVLAFVFLVVPTFLMGLSMPLAVKIYSGWKRTTGRAVGEVLTYNTLGAVLGAAVSGYALLYFLGIERSLQALCIVNICSGLMITARGNKWRTASVTVLLILSLAAFRGMAIPGSRVWDLRFLATYTPDRAALYQDDAKSQREIDNHEVLYYAEGFDSIVSSTLRKDTRAIQFTVNGRPEASTNLKDVQNQYMLGHLPMLLHKNPEKVLVIGAGSGMTLAAVASHPSLKKLHLVEIEPKVLGVARAFGEYNHKIVDHPDLKIVYDDARNYLMATQQRFDVITADPIHPIWRGSGYLYTSEYFRMAAERLSPGGIMCQWVPLYLLSVDNVRSIVKTFRQNFKYVMVWLTMDDVQIVGSNEPLLIDAVDIDRRIKEPGVHEDLRSVFMGSADELFAYFLMGNRGAKAFAQNAVVNTDDNVYLEFSSPETISEGATEAANVSRLVDYRENIINYAKEQGEHGSMQHMHQESKQEQAAADRAQLLYLSSDKDPRTMEKIRAELDGMKLSGRMKSLRVGLLGYE